MLSKAQDEQNELGIPIKDLKAATASKNPQLLARLAQHPNTYIRAAAAINPNLRQNALQLLLNDKNPDDLSRKNPGVVEHALRNPKLTKRDFVFTHNTISLDVDYRNVWSTLAGHHFAQLKHLVHWSRSESEVVRFSVLDNFAGRDPVKFAKIIEHMLPLQDKRFEEWTMIEKIAYNRCYGLRQPRGN